MRYVPPPSLVPFLKSAMPQSFVVGPFGSGKTTASLIKVAYEARQVAACEDGVRRSRIAVVRNTKPMLKDSTIPDFLRIYPDGVAGEYRMTEGTFLLRFDDVECEVLFRGLDDANDARRLLSTQLTFALVDEVREIDQAVFEALTGRVGRYPNGMMVPHRPEWGLDRKGFPVAGCVDDHGRPCGRLWGATNPADEGTFWHEYLTHPTDIMHVSIQPSGLSPEADWIQYLQTDYYENLAKGKSDDWVDVYVHGKWGKSMLGRPVITSFRRELHVVDGPLPALPQQPVVVGVDAGLTPAAVVTQTLFDGRLRVFDAVPSEGMGALRFAREKLKPLLVRRFPGCPVLLVLDPAALQRAQTDERTVASVYRAEGFRVMPARSNQLITRLNAVDQYMTRMVNGKPAIEFDREGCGPLIDALGGMYRYKKTRNEVGEPVVEKSHPYSDLADALQYACMHAGSGVAASGTRVRPVSPAPYKWV